MRKLLINLLLFVSTTVFACGGGDWEGAYFYNLFNQTNISAEQYYPFLRTDYSAFYGQTEYWEEQKDDFPKGNISLWRDLLKGWSRQDVSDAVYKNDSFKWLNKLTLIENSAKTYIEFANKCSNAFSYKSKINSWNYDEVVDKVNIDTRALLQEANLLLKKETNQQLVMRYHYQVVRILHYSKEWNEAINYYDNKITDKFPKNEIYYYTLDQVAGCYYSVEKYEKAAYLFTKVVNNSVDRKMSAFSSYNFCTHKGAEGRAYFVSDDDKKDLLLIKSLREFSDPIQNINKFIDLAPLDPRVELLFMRALSDLERSVWPKYISVSDKTLPFLKECNTYENLLLIAEKQVNNRDVSNRDFWKLASSYLSFINSDIPTAQKKLLTVRSFPTQKSNLSIIYEVFSWSDITAQNEDLLTDVLKIKNKQESWQYNSENDWRILLLAKVANTYYKNSELAKAFLVHNTLNSLNNLSSIELLNSLSDFYYKIDKSSYEKFLLTKMSNKSGRFIDYVNYQKGVYYLQQKNPHLAQEYFNKNSAYKSGTTIPNSIFSNNIVECFGCIDSDVMQDEVYKADVFSFIKPIFSPQELTKNLIELEKLTTDERKWKVKLAYYLLANYYYNISNTGFYRGLLTGNSNCCDYSYIGYAENSYYTPKIGEDIIKKNKGYNLSNISNFSKKYFDFASISMEYYEKVISYSSDKELNARCLYMMAKCELNDFYNNGGDDFFEVKYSRWSKLKLPNYKSFKTLKDDYSDTKFHDMIIQECSYFRMYSSQ